MFGLAAYIYRAVKDSNLPQYKKFMKFWTGVGGDESVLMRAVTQGMKVEYKHHANKHKEKNAVFTFVDEMSGYRWATPNELPDRVAPLVAAPAVAATPLIIKIASLLKSMGIDTKDLGKKVISIAQKEAVKIAEHAIKKGDNPEIDPKSGERILDIVHPADEDNKKHSLLYKDGVPDFKTSKVSYTDNEKKTGGNNILIYIVIAVLLLFAFKSSSNG